MKLQRLFRPVKDDKRVHFDMYGVVFLYRTFDIQIRQII
jgi:hypothetical protein